MTASASSKRSHSASSHDHTPLNDCDKNAVAGGEDEILHAKLELSNEDDEKDEASSPVRSTTPAASPTPEAAEPPKKRAATAVNGVSRGQGASLSVNGAPLNRSSLLCPVEFNKDKIEVIAKWDFNGKKQYTDLILKAAGGRISVHKLFAVSQSGYLAKIIEKKKTKAELTLDMPVAVLSAVVRYLYIDDYEISSTFKAEWKIQDNKNNRAVEFHHRVHKAAEFLEIPKLDTLAMQYLNDLMLSDTFSDEICAKLTENASPEKRKKAPETPIGVTEAVISTQALKVKEYIEKDHMNRDEAFHKAVGAINHDFLADFIVAVGDAIGSKFRLYLRCPDCSSIIRNKNPKSGRFSCTHHKGNDPPGELVFHLV